MRRKSINARLWSRQLEGGVYGPDPDRRGYGYALCLSRANSAVLNRSGKGANEKAPNTASADHVGLQERSPVPCRLFTHQQ